MHEELPSQGKVVTPHPELSAEDIRAQLERIVTSSEFPSGGRGAAFLTYVVEETLAGRADRIKGYSIAISVFKRNESFTQEDPVVRIEAGRLRRVLERYYLVAGSEDPIRIDIPKGGYVPTIAWNRPSPDARVAETVEFNPTERPKGIISQRSFSLLASAVVALLTILWWLHVPLFTSDREPGATEPALVVEPFSNLGDSEIAERYATGLTEELLTALPRFKEIKVIGQGTSKVVGTGMDARFMVGGGVRVSENLVRITARLLDTRTGEILWSQIYEDDISARDLFATQSDVAGKIAASVAQPYGIIARAGAAEPPSDDLGVQACMSGFYTYRAELSAERHAQVRDCLEKAVTRQPHFPTAWAMLSLIYLDEGRFKFNTRSGPTTPTERSLEAARRAVRQDVNNTRGQQALMTALFFSNQVAEALKVGEQALKINPNDTELLGEFGTRVAMSGQWRRGADLLDRAMALNPAAGGYYHGMRALAAYMLYEDDLALAEIRKADLQKFPLYHAVAAVIYINAGLTDDARREAELFNRLRPDFIPNIVAELKSRNYQPADRARLIADIRKAGLPALDELVSTTLPAAPAAPLQP